MSLLSLLPDGYGIKLEAMPGVNLIKLLGAYLGA